MTVQDLETLMLESKHGEMTYIIKGPMITNWQDGFPRQEPKQIVFQFDRFMLDLGDEMRRMELTDEDKEYVLHRVERDLKDPDMRTDIWVHEPPKIQPPWPTYDTMHANAVPGMAAQVGMIDDALLYEQRRVGGARESVVKKLLELQDRDLPPVNEDDFAAV